MSNLILAMFGIVAAIGCFFMWWNFKARRARQEFEHDYSPEALMRKSREFNARKERDTQKLRKEFELAVVNGVGVAEVGDMVWWPQIDGTVLLAAVKLENGKFLALGYDNGTFVIPEASKFSWALDNLTELPRLNLDDDHVAVWFANGRYIMAEHGWHNTMDLRWRYTGIGSSGTAALKEFAKHGMTFSIEPC